MYRNGRFQRRASLCAVVLSTALAACSQSMDALDSVKTSSVSTASSSHGYQMPRGGSAKERECLARAMFFESIRSSREGLVAVGSVVMNRVNSDRYPDTICEVVGQKNQFAPGVLSRPMNSRALPDVMAAADAVLAGERHPAVHRKVKFFHQAGLSFPYRNMNYVAEAGGNAFYQKLSRAEMRQVAEAGAAKKASAFSFTVEQKSADAIGAMLAGQKRPDAPVE